MSDRRSESPERNRGANVAGLGIGGDFGLEPHHARVEAAGDLQSALALPAGKWTLFSSARGALAWLLRDQDLNPGDEVLLPS